VRELTSGVSSMALHLVVAVLAALVAREKDDEQTQEEEAKRMRHLRIEALAQRPASYAVPLFRDSAARDRDGASPGDGGLVPPRAQGEVGAPLRSSWTDAAPLSRRVASPPPRAPALPDPLLAGATPHERHSQTLAGELGMIGLLRSEPRGRGLDTWGRHDGLAGSLESSAWNDAFGSAGPGDYDLSGTGLGFGTLAAGVAAGAVGTIGGGTGGYGEGFGCACGWGLEGHMHMTRAPVLRCGDPFGAPPGGGGCNLSVNGRLPPEAIQRIVRQSFGRFRLCYETGLARDPALAGRVITKFVVARDGSVASGEDAGSDLPDPSVVACVVRSFLTLSFPQPEGGEVVVSYPIRFRPAP